MCRCSWIFALNGWIHCRRSNNNNHSTCLLIFIAYSDALQSNRIRLSVKSQHKIKSINPDFFAYMRKSCISTIWRSSEAIICILIQWMRKSQFLPKNRHSLLEDSLWVAFCHISHSHLFTVPKIICNARKRWHNWSSFWILSESTIAYIINHCSKLVKHG